MHHEERELQSGQYGFGSFAIKMVVDGDFDRPSDAADHIAAFTYTATLLECVRCFVTDGARWGDGRVKESISVTVEVGDSTLKLDFIFSLTRDIRREKLEKIISSMSLPMAQQTLGYYLHGADSLVAAPDERSLATSLGDTTKIDTALREQKFLEDTAVGSGARRSSRQATRQ